MSQNGEEWTKEDRRIFQELEMLQNGEQLPEPPPPQKKKEIQRLINFQSACIQKKLNSFGKI
jgi:hypothetical protein